MGIAMCRRVVPVLLLCASVAFGCGGSQEERDDNGPVLPDGGHPMVRGMVHPADAGGGVGGAGAGGTVVATGTGGAVAGTGGVVGTGTGGAIVATGTGGRMGAGGRMGTGGGAIVGTGGVPGTGGIIVAAGTGGRINGTGGAIVGTGGVVVVPGTGGMIVPGAGGMIVAGTGGADGGVVLPDCPANLNNNCRNRGAMCSVVSSSTRRDQVCFCADDSTTWMCPDLGSGTLDTCPRDPAGGACMPRDAVCQLSQTRFCFCSHDRVWTCSP